MTLDITSTDPVADAEREATEAEGLVDALAERIRDGDETVDAAQLVSARSLAEVAGLRAEAAKRKAQRARADAARARAREVLESVRVVHLRDEDLVTAWSAAVESLRAVVKVAQGRNGVVLGLDQDVQVARARLRRDAGEDLGRAFGIEPSLYHGETGFRVKSAGIDAAVLDVGQIVGTVVKAGVPGTVHVRRADVLEGMTMTLRVDGWAAAITEAGPA